MTWFRLRGRSGRVAAVLGIVGVLAACSPGDGIGAPSVDAVSDGVLDVHAQLGCADLQLLPQSCRQLGDYLFPIIGGVRGSHAATLLAA